METLSPNWEVIKTSEASLMGLPPKSIAEIKSGIKSFKLAEILEINLKQIRSTN
tara:strand:+ start:136 stop:297 length:162 start_codon:yes stop_codon:yes gene_type:complete